MSRLLEPKAPRAVERPTWPATLLAGVWAALAAFLWSLPLARYGNMLQSLMHTASPWQGGVLALVIGSGIALWSMQRRGGAVPEGLSLKTLAIALVLPAGFLAWAAAGGGLGAPVLTAAGIDAALALLGVLALSRLPSARGDTALYALGFGLVALALFAGLAAGLFRFVPLPWTSQKLSPPYFPTMTSAVLLGAGFLAGLAAGLSPLGRPGHGAAWRLVGRTALALSLLVVLINPLVTSIALGAGTPPTVKIQANAPPAGGPPGVTNLRHLGTVDVGGITYHLQAGTLGPGRCALIMIAGNTNAYGNLTACEGVGVTQTTLFSERSWRFWQPGTPPLRFHLRFGEIIDPRVVRITARLAGQSVEASIAGKLWLIDLLGAPRNPGLLTDFKAFDAAGKPMPDVVFDADQTAMR